MSAPAALGIIPGLLAAGLAPGALASVCSEDSGWLAHKCPRIAEALRKAQHISDTNEDSLGISCGRWLGDWHGIYLTATSSFFSVTSVTEHPT